MLSKIIASCCFDAEIRYISVLLPAHSRNRPDNNGPSNFMVVLLIHKIVSLYCFVIEYTFLRDILFL